MTATPLRFRDVEELYAALAATHGPLADLPETLAEIEAQDAALAARMDETAVPLLVTALRRLRGSRALFDTFVFGDAARLLVQLARQRPEPVARALFDCLDENGPAEVIEALGDTGLASTVALLLARVSRRHADPELREALAGTLEVLDGEPARASWRRGWPRAIRRRRWRPSCGGSPSDSAWPRGEKAGPLDSRGPPWRVGGGWPARPFVAHGGAGLSAWPGREVRAVRPPLRLGGGWPIGLARPRGEGRAALRCA
ncbi:hypothetical protein [Nannocystis pusilla]|uniref:hypothetical protein n=1 Tax=Nannocystis pusilla TaxID=889268 RepID=UPI003B7834E2